MRFPEHIGRYETQSVAGVGGFAVVVRAYDEALADHVAIKILAANWAADDDIRSRFVEEARLLRRLHSQHLISVHDIGELDDGRPYFVMDFADRGTLADRLSTGAAGADPVSLGNIIEAVAGSLSVVHEAGYVHRDVNPRNLLLKRVGRSTRGQGETAATTMRAGLVANDERLLLGDLGLAKDIIRSGTASVIGGSPGYQAPEQGRADTVITPAADVYGATALLWATMAGEPPPLDGLDAHLASLEPRWSHFFEQGLAADPTDRFDGISTWAEAARRALQSGAQAIAVPAARPAATALSPYQGLAAYQPEDADRFFGREELTDELVARLSRERTLVIGGASGSGKSSLMRAGLIPAVASGAIAGAERWPVALFVPGNAPLQELEYQLLKAWRTTHPTAPSAPDVSRDDPHRLRRVADEITTATGGTLLCVDQFEELFTHQTTRADQEAFLEALAGLVDPADSQVRLIIAMRADFYSNASQFPWLARRITDNQLLVGPMTHAELREAIEGPARQAGLRLDTGLADLILEEGGGEPGALPLVSHALVETWKRRQGNRMTLEGYRRAGGVAGAISQSAESVFTDRFDDAERDAARRLFLRLVNPGEGTADTRRTLPIGELASALEPDITASVIDTLTDARLLTATEASLQMAHEALIQTWPRFRAWIDESRDDLRFRQRIARAASEWEAGDRDPDLLYRGTPLASAREWQDAHRTDLSPIEADFLEASDAAERERLRLAMETSARTRRNRRIAVGALGVLAISAVIASIVAFVAFQRAQRNEEIATERLSGSLGTQSSVLAVSHPRLALALAVEAMALGDEASPEARAGLLDASQTLAMSTWVPAGSSQVVGDANAVGIHPSGAVVITGNKDGSLRLWRSRDGGSLGEPIPGHTGAIERIVFSDDGRLMLTGGLDRRVLAWDVSDLPSVPSPVEVAELSDLVWGLDVSSDGSLAAVASENGTVTLWDVPTGQQLGEPLIEFGFDFLTVSFSPDDSRLLAGTGQGELFGWNVDDRTPIVAGFPAHGSDLWEIVFSPDGETVATRSSDGRVLVWLTDSVELGGEPFGAMSDDVRGIAFSPDGSELLGGDSSGRLLVADIVGGTGATASSVGHSEQVTDAALAPDGSVFATLGLDQTLRLWRPGLDPGGMRLSGFADGAFGVAVHAGIGRMAVGDGTGMVRILESDGVEVGAVSVSPGAGPVWSVAFDAAGDRVVAGAEDGHVVVFTTDGEVELSPFTAHEERVNAVLFSPDGDALLTASDDRTVRAWDATTGELVAEMGPHDGAVTGIALSPDGRSLVASDFSGALTIWNWRNGEERQQFQVEDTSLTAVAWSPSGDLLAAGSADEVVIVLDAESGEQLGELTPHRGGATAVRFLSEQTIVTASRSGDVRVWDSGLFTQLGLPLVGHADAVWRVEVLDTGQFLSASADGMVILWDGLDTDRACEKAGDVWGDVEVRTFLGADTEPQGCRP